MYIYWVSLCSTNTLPPSGTSVTTLSLWLTLRGGCTCWSNGVSASLLCLSREQPRRKGQGALVYPAAKEKGAGGSSEANVGCAAAGGTGTTSGAGAGRGGGLRGRRVGTRSGGGAGGTSSMGEVHGAGGEAHGGGAGSWRANPCVHGSGGEGHPLWADWGTKWVDPGVICTPTGLATAGTQLTLDVQFLTGVNACASVAAAWLRDPRKDSLPFVLVGGLVSRKGLRCAECSVPQTHMQIGCASSPLGSHLLLPGHAYGGGHGCSGRVVRDRGLGLYRNGLR